MMLQNISSGRTSRPGNFGELGTLELLAEGRGAVGGAAQQHALPRAPLHLSQDAELQRACLQNAEEPLPEQFEQLGLDETAQGTTTGFLKHFLQHDVHEAIQQDSRLKIMQESAEVFNQNTEACFQGLSVRLPTLLACWAHCEGCGKGAACLQPLLDSPYPCLKCTLSSRLAGKWQHCHTSSGMLPVAVEHWGKTPCHCSVVSPV